MGKKRNEPKCNLQKVLLGHKGKNIKVGAVNGISFIYCDILPESDMEVIKLFEKLDDDYHKKLKDIQQADIARIKNLEAAIGQRKKLQSKEIYKRLIDIALNTDKDIKQIDINSLMAEIDAKFIEERQRELSRLLKKIRRQQEHLNNWIPLLQREVEIMRESIKVDDTIPAKDFQNFRALIIEYEGDEHGAYWDRYEYINGVSKEEGEEDDEQ